MTRVTPISGEGVGAQGAAGPRLRANAVRDIRAAKEGLRMEARVGKPAPDFETKAYVKGEIKSVKLSDYKGQWVMLYFYPGDFTFV